MDLAELDALLARYRDAERRSGVALVDLDADPSLRMLTTGVLQGETARRVGAAVRNAPALWSDYELLRGALAAIEQVRGTSRRVDDATRAEVERLLTGASVAVATPATPDDPSLLGAGPAPTMLTIDQLINRMTTAYGTLVTAVAAVDAMWSRAVPQLDAARRALEPLRRRAAAIDVAAEPALDSLADLVASTERTLGDDPLGLTDADLAALDAALDLANARIGSLEAAHVALEADLEAAKQIRRTMIETLNAVRETYADAVMKIVAPEGVADLGADDLARFRALHEEAVAVLDRAPGTTEHWRTQRVRLDAWTTRATSLLGRLQGAVAANIAPVRRRDELRGLAAAFEAKAAGRRRIEHPETVEHLRALRDELGRAPCDLTRAASLLEALARELSTKDEP